MVFTCNNSQMHLRLFCPFRRAPITVSTNTSNGLSRTKMLTATNREACHERVTNHQPLEYNISVGTSSAFSCIKTILLSVLFHINCNHPIDLSFYMSSKAGLPLKCCLSLSFIFYIIIFILYNILNAAADVMCYKFLAML